MITALCFIKVAPDSVNAAGEAIARIPGVRSAYSVTGQIDLVALIEVTSHDDVAHVVTDGIGSVPGVTSTETHIAFRTYSRDDLEAGFSIGAGD